jgi:uncharacterized protein (DUF2141 family)
LAAYRSFFKPAGRVRACVLALCIVLLGVESVRGEDPEATAALAVLVTGFPSDEGVAFVGLFESRGSYDDPDASPDESARLEIHDGQVRWRVESLAPGDYALRVYHDANGNQRLDRGRRGIPREHFGFSNNPARRRGPAPWQDARFELGPGETHVEIELLPPTGDAEEGRGPPSH